MDRPRAAQGNGPFCAFGVLVVLAYVSPWLIHGEDSYVRIHDSLDSNMIWHILTAREGIWFAPNGALVAPVLAGGAPRISFPSEMKLITLLFAMLEPYWAYVAHQFAIRLIAYFGMAFLMLQIIPASVRHRFWLAAAAGTAFAIVPFWAWTGASAAVAMVALAYWRLWAGKGVLLPVLLLAAYPFVSSIVLGGMFVVGFGWLIVFWSVLKHHRGTTILVATCVLTMAQIAAEYRLFLFLLSPDFVPHRVEFALGDTDLAYAFRLFFGDFLRSASGVESQQFPVVLVSAATALSAAAWFRFSGIGRRRIPSGNGAALSSHERRILFLLILALVACATFSLFFALWEWPGTQIVRDAIPILKQVNLARTNYFNPFAWSLALALSMALLTARSTLPVGRAIIALLMALQVRVAVLHHEFAAEKRHSGITFSQFYSRPLFERMATELGIDRRTALVASFGLHPSIAQFNGFMTADAYLFLYPLSYKHRFGNMMRYEFNRSTEVRSYFEGFGSRVYMFSAELRCPRSDSHCTSKKPHSVDRLEVSAAMMQSLGIDYLFSIARIGNAVDAGLIDLGTFDDPESAWSITVYQTDAGKP